MQYQLVYDIQQTGYPNWWIIALGVFWISLGLYCYFVSDSPGSKRDRKKIIVVIFGLLILGAEGIGYSNFAELRSAARNGKYEVVEGQVKDFVPMPYEGHSKESFVVNEYKFSYSDYDLTKGFNQSQSHGGPIREGLQVRITHVNGSIVKLEIAK